MNAVRRHLIPIAVATGALATCVVRFAQAPTGVRGPLVLAFALLCPGAAIVPLLRLRDRVGEFAVAIGVSLACNAVLALGMAYAHAWSPDAGLVILAGLTLAGAAANILTAERGS